MWCFCFRLKLKGAVIQCVTQQPAWLKCFWFLITQWLIVLHCGLPRCHVYYPPVLISSCYVSTHTGGWSSQRKHKPKYLIFPLAHLWNVARCRMMLTPQTKMEMWRYLWFWIIYLLVLTTLVSNHRLYLVPVFPPRYYHFQNGFVFEYIVAKKLFLLVYIFQYKSLRHIAFCLERFLLKWNPSIRH